MIAEPLPINATMMKRRGKPTLRFLKLPDQPIGRFVQLTDLSNEKSKFLPKFTIVLNDTFARGKSFMTGDKEK